MKRGVAPGRRELVLNIAFLGRDDRTALHDKDEHKRNKFGKGQKVLFFSPKV
jgi:hypothetical protein